MNVNFNDLNKLQKYCDNRIDQPKFIELMKAQYNDESYIIGKWISFKNNPIQFITSRAERFLLAGIINEINSTDYQG